MNSVCFTAEASSNGVVERDFTVTTWGSTVAAIDAPGHGDRPRTAEDERAVAGFRQAQADGDAGRFESVSVRYAISLAERAVPEWQATLDALQELPEIGTEGPVGYGGDSQFLARHLAPAGTSPA
jgi:hypothetical protein